MTYKCYECGHIFEEGEEKYTGDGWNEPEISCCPVCGDSFGIAKVCIRCGGCFLEDEMKEGMCEDCASKAIAEYSFNHIEELYLMSEDSSEEIKVNSFIASMFSPSQINELLLSELIKGNKLKNIDCSDFIKSDESWFLEKLAKLEGGEIMADKKTNQIHIKLRDDEKNRIKEKAEKIGLSVSAYIRWKALS